MATNVTVIGRTTRVRGHVTGATDLDVQGFVEGDIAVGGDVTVDAQGMIGASVRGRRVVVRGAIKGDLVGDEAVLLEEGARVVGDVRAPRVAIAQGALVRGYVQTGEGDGSASRAVRAQTAVRPATATQPQPRTAAASATDGAATRRPPPPIVPALKKAKGQIAKKKER
jgi:cytoskeletal protein CcmA (bactofilin family)